jgi:hypothetical protein
MITLSTILLIWGIIGGYKYHKYLHKHQNKNTFDFINNARFNEFWVIGYFALIIIGVVLFIQFSITKLP